jgi:hypothetical protein
MIHLSRNEFSCVMAVFCTIPVAQPGSALQGRDVLCSVPVAVMA